jgi:hypothetical protein
MCCCHQCLLHHFCANWVNNDNIHQSSKIVSGDKDIHLSLGVAREKVGDLHLNMCSTFQSNNYNNISKCVMGYHMFTPTRASKQMGT